MAAETAGDLVRPSRVSGVPAALDQLRGGRFVVLVGSRGERDEGHLVIAAEHVTPGAVNFAATHARGVIAVALPERRCDELELWPISTAEDNMYGSSVGVSVEARSGVTTGISAADRARTIGVAADPRSTANDLVRPGHVVTLRARDGGVLVRAGRSEAAVDLARLADCVPAAAVCEILDSTGDVASAEELAKVARQHALVLVTVDDVVAYRRQRESLVKRTASVRLPTAYGELRAVAYQERGSSAVHLAVVRGDVAGAGRVIVAVHGECPTGDIFRAETCTCRAELDAALHRVASAARGILVYLTDRARGDRLAAALTGHSEAVPEVRFGAAPPVPTHGIAAQILADLGPRDVHLLSDERDGSESELEALGVRVSGHVPLGVRAADAGARTGRPGTGRDAPR